MSLSSGERLQYSAIIDDILESGDLQTISAKQIRKGLQARLDIDILEKKEAIQALILERFDRASSSVEALPPSSATEPQSNGHAAKGEKAAKSVTPKSDRDQSGDHDDDDADHDLPPPKKKLKQERPEYDDAKLAAMLQAQENSRSRPTRPGTERKRIIKKTNSKVKKEKRKSAAKIKNDEDSDLELDSDGEVKEKPKKGGFHKQYNLSEPLAELVGDPTLSRPQVVKKIWEHIKAEGLQDPSDKRQIRCDARMHSVFKQDHVHMFTMNKLLGKHLYDVEE